MSIEFSDRGKGEIVGTADPGASVNVTISIGDIRVQFNGSADSVISSVIEFHLITLFPS